MNEKVNRTLVKFSAVGVYLLIAFEFFYMASPFAMYFYSVYKPGLGIIDRIPLLAWSTGFFMPHLVMDTQSGLLNNIPFIGALIASLGFTLFVICASQIYYSKIFRNRAVTGGIYKFVRHPQYAAFAICSFGLLLLWPRYLTLFFYVTLIFVYYWLARREEKECIQKFGKDYLLYKENTAMFFPIPAWFKSSLQGALSRINILLVYILVTGISLLAAVGIKNWSVKQLYTYTSDNGIWLGIGETRESEFRELSALIGDSPLIDSIFRNKVREKSEIIYYVLPAGMYISEIPMVKPEDEDCHVGSGNYDNSIVKIIITRGIYNNPSRILKGSQLLRNTLTLKPITEVWIDMESDNILKIVDLPPSGRYTNIPEPVF